MSAPKTEVEFDRIAEALNAGQFSFGEGLDQARRFARMLERENARLKATLEDISTFAHCTAKAGPLHTPDLAAAWGKFMEIDVKAKAALSSEPRQSGWKS